VTDELIRSSARRDPGCVNAVQVLMELDRRGMLSRGRTIVHPSLNSPAIYFGESSKNGIRAAARHLALVRAERMRDEMTFYYVRSRGVSLGVAMPLQWVTLT
jgi:hypothetical protein